MTRLRHGIDISDRVEAILAEDRPTPFLVVDLDVVAERYRQLGEALGGMAVYYAVKANPHPEVVALLAAAGCRFDVASWGEVELCRAAGASASDMSFGNTVKRRSDIAAAFGLGITNFAFDCTTELEKLLDVAPGSTATCRILCEGDGAAWPLSKKFGCEPDQALELLRRAASGGLGLGVSFHVGSQQIRPEAWDEALGAVAWIRSELGDAGIELGVVNLGGGFPSNYGEAAPGIDRYGRAIRDAVDRHLGDDPPTLVLEPGRYLVGDAGTLQTEVLLVSRRDPHDPLRWVYLDVGVFTGLVEAMGEAIRYPVRTRRDGGPVGPAVLAGPTCDSLDVLYERLPYQLPLDLAEGDLIQLGSAGAYTSTCSSVGFNGFPPLETIVVGTPTRPL